MSEKTYFVLQEFELVKKRWTPKIPREVPSRDVAARAVERIKALNRPVIAFSRKGDMVTGEFEEADLIACFNVPPEFMGDTADV